MRIQLVSNPPWASTGYGTQCAQLARQLQAGGHEVFVQASLGLQDVTLQWEGITVVPASYRRGANGNDLMAWYAEYYESDLIIALCDAYVLDTEIFPLLRCPLAVWAPVDQAPLGHMNRKVLSAQQARPVAMSKFGQDVMSSAGIAAWYAPHAVDTSSLFVPPTPEQRKLTRDQLGVSDSTFVIGINAANASLFRKGWFEQFAAYAQFRRRHPDSVLLAHTIKKNPGAGLDLVALMRMFGIEDHVIMPDNAEVITGMLSAEELVRQFYHSIDILSNCSYAEGFGLAPLEAQSCGVPVVVTDFSAMPEVAAPGNRGGWLVPGSPFHAIEHGASLWVRPNMAQIETAYGTLWGEREAGVIDQRQEAARQHAVSTYDQKTVYEQHWMPVLDALEHSRV